MKRERKDRGDRRRGSLNITIRGGARARGRLRVNILISSRRGKLTASCDEGSVTVAIPRLRRNDGSKMARKETALGLAKLCLEISWFTGTMRLEDVVKDDQRLKMLSYGNCHVGSEVTTIVMAATT